MVNVFEEMLTSITLNRHEHTDTQLLQNRLFISEIVFANTVRFFEVFSSTVQKMNQNAEILDVMMHRRTKNRKQGRKHAQKADSQGAKS